MLLSLIKSQQNYQTKKQIKIKNNILKSCITTTVATSSLLLGTVDAQASSIEIDRSLLNKETSTEKTLVASANDAVFYQERSNDFLNPQQYSQIIAQSSRKAQVTSPPSNIRNIPNGKVICSVRSSTSINVYSYYDGWYETDYCGWGYIHESQIKFSQYNRIAKSNTFCNVINIQRGQLALRDYPDGEWRVGLNNGNIVRHIHQNGIWSYVQVEDTPNNRLIGLKGWVNSNYLACL